MQPILDTSRDWTPMPDQLCEPVKELIVEDVPELKNQNGMQCVIHVEGRIYSEELQFRVGFRHPDQITQHNFEVSSFYSKKAQVEEKIDHGFHLAISVMKDFVASNYELELPREWKELSDGNWFQYSTVNTDLESQADALLQQADESLVRERPTTEDALEDAIKVSDPETLRQVVKQFKKNSTTLH